MTTPFGSPRNLAPRRSRLGLAGLALVLTMFASPLAGQATAPGTAGHREVGVAVSTSRGGPAMTLPRDDRVRVVGDHAGRNEADRTRHARSGGAMAVDVGNTYARTRIPVPLCQGA